MARHDPLALPALPPAPAGFRLPHVSRWGREMARVPIYDRGRGVPGNLTGFPSLGVDHEGGLRAAARRIRARYERAAPAAGVANESKALDLFAVAMRAWWDRDGWPNVDFAATLPLALGLGSRAEKLKAALQAGRVHPADHIFDKAREREAAARVASAVAANPANVPREVKWALLLLIDGHACRGTPPPIECLFALAGALGLLDGNGHGHAGLSLAGVKERRALIERAAVRAFAMVDDQFEFDPRRIPDERSDTDFEDSPLFLLAINDNLRRFGEPPIDDDDDDRMQFFGDLSAAIS